MCVCKRLYVCVSEGIRMCVCVWPCTCVNVLCVSASVCVCERECVCVHG